MRVSKPSMIIHHVIPMPKGVISVPQESIIPYFLFEKVLKKEEIFDLDSSDYSLSIPLQL